MTGAGLMNFLIALVGLALIVGLCWIALVKIAPDPWFNQIGRYAIGGAALLAFLVAVKIVLFGGGGGMASFGPEAVIEFAIGLVVLVIVVTLIYMGVDAIAPAQFVIPVKYVIGGLALIVVLMLAERALFGGGWGLIPAGTFRLK